MNLAKISEQQPDHVRIAILSSFLSLLTTFFIVYLYRHMIWDCTQKATHYQGVAGTYTSADFAVSVHTCEYIYDIHVHMVSENRNRMQRNPNAITTLFPSQYSGCQIT